MISRRTAAVIGDTYADEFGEPLEYILSRERIYDFLFVCGFAPWFCNSVKQLGYRRTLKEHIMRLHTGETLETVTANWDWDARQKLGQAYLTDLARHILSYHKSGSSDTYYRNTFGSDRISVYSFHGRDTAMMPEQVLLKSLELDGYVYHDSRLIPPESDVLDTQEEGGVLASLFNELRLDNWPVAKHCLTQSEEHWLSGKWDACINEARRFMECVLQESAAVHSLRIKLSTLAKNTYERPVEVRKYLETESLLEQREVKTVAEVYGLLSNVGSHPNIARKDQARLLRQVALIFSHFVMLRLKDCLPT